MYELTEVPQHGIHRFFHPSFPHGPETESITPIGTPNPLAALPFTNSSPCFIPAGVIISDLAETSQDDLNPTIPAVILVPPSYYLRGADGGQPCR
jgi:hypothetical protein